MHPVDDVAISLNAQCVECDITHKPGYVATVYLGLQRIKNCN